MKNDLWNWLGHARLSNALARLLICWLIFRALQPQTVLCRLCTHTEVCLARPKSFLIESAFQCLEVSVRKRVCQNGELPLAEFRWSSIDHLQFHFFYFLFSYFIVHLHLFLLSIHQAVHLTRLSLFWEKVLPENSGLESFQKIQFSLIAHTFVTFEYSVVGVW